jgi:2-dehydro-3-deoxyphosphogluconate aldolase/(4S)-4-hydroxy-2-oxoglutarate aldolase
MNPIERVMRTAPVIPVLVIDDASEARPLAEALVAGGLTVLEVTLRTPAALDAIREMKQSGGARRCARCRGRVYRLAGPD